MPCVILLQVGAEPVDVVFGVVWRRLSGEKRGVCRGGRPRADRAGGGVEVYTLPSTNQQTELQHLWVSAVDGHGVVSGEWPLLTSSSISDDHWPSKALFYKLVNWFCALNQIKPRTWLNWNTVHRQHLCSWWTDLMLKFNFLFCFVWKKLI